MIRTFKEAMPVDGEQINLFMYSFELQEWGIFAGKFRADMFSKTNTEYSRNNTCWSRVESPHWIPQPPPITVPPQVISDEVKQEEVQPQAQVPDMPASEVV